MINDIDRASKRIRESLLEVADTGLFRPLHGDVQRVNVQIIATTNRTPEEFEEIREDLASRLSEIEIIMPSLAVRRFDIPLLVRFFLKKFDSDHIRLLPETWHQLLNTDWRDNVRGIEQVVRMDIVAQKVQTVTPQHLLSRRKAPLLDDPQVDLIDASEYFAGWIDLSVPISVFVTDFLYPPYMRPQEDWAQFSMRAFLCYRDGLERLGRMPSVLQYASVGCGVGLDAIAAERILKARSFVLSDLWMDVVAVARENLLLNSHDTQLEDICRIKSDLFEGFDKTVSADVIYENLPNIPVTFSDKKISTGRKTGTYLLENSASQDGSYIDQWLLSSHSRFLLGAKRLLSPGGIVICSIGARVPWNLVEKMFSDAGYEAELLVFDLKEQEEATEVVAAYARVESEESVRFRFFRLAEARNLLDKLCLEIGSDYQRISGFAGQRDVTEIRLAGVELSAQEALQEVRKNIGVGHMVYVVKGVPVLPGATQNEAVESRD